MESWLTNPTTYILILGVLGALYGVGLFIFKVGEWKGNVDKSLNSFKDIMEEIRSNFREILNRLPKSTYQGSSPIALTDLSEKISDELDAKSWAKQKAKYLISYEIKPVKILPEFQIQEYCEEFVEKEDALADIDLEIRKSSYEHGLNREQVVAVVMIELRDAMINLLEEHGFEQET